MKGWKNKMENNTTHGRKVIRGKQQSYKIVKRRFLLFTLAVLLIGAIIGSVIAGISTKNKQTTSEKNEYIMQQVNHYGAYDGRVFTSEISMDWSGDEYDFIPLNCKLDESTQQFTFYL